MAKASPKPRRGDDPCRRPLSFQSFAEAAAQTRELQDGYLRCGRWSLAQVCQHLTLFMDFSLEGFPGKRLPRPAAWALRVVLLNGRSLRRPMPKGLPAPAYLQPPDADAGHAYGGATPADHAAADRFVAVCRRVEAHAGAFRPSPLFGKLAPDVWRRVHLKHAEHHLGFLVPTATMDLDAAAAARGAAP